MRFKRAATVLALALLAGCGGSNSAVESPQASTPPTVAATDDVVLCHGHEVPVARLTNPRPASELENGPPQGLYENRPGDLGDLTDYSIVDDEPDFVSIIRLHPRDERKPRPEFTHDLNAWKYVAAEPGAKKDWMLWSATTCALQRSFEGMEVATTYLDPDALPQPGDRTVQLLVHENACANGKPATGRVRVPVLEMTERTVRLVIAVEALGTATCPGNPNTPFTLELPEPLGERTLMDVGTYSEREIKVPKGA